METRIALARVSFTIADAAIATGISERTIRDAIADGVLVAHGVGAKSSKPILRAVDLDEWLESLPVYAGRGT